jgi:hypothetical protein
LDLEYLTIGSPTEHFSPAPVTSTWGKISLGKFYVRNSIFGVHRDQALPVEQESFIVFILGLLLNAEELEGSIGLYPELYQTRFATYTPGVCFSAFFPLESCLSCFVRYNSHKSNQHGLEYLFRNSHSGDPEKVVTFDEGRRIAILRQELLAENAKENKRNPGKKLKSEVPWKILIFRNYPAKSFPWKETVFHSKALFICELISWNIVVLL